MSDNDRIAYLTGDTNQTLDADDRAELDELQAVLADPKLWAEPSPTLEDGVIDTITHANTTTDRSPRAIDRTASVVDLDRARRRPRRPKPQTLAAAAAAAIAVIALSAIALTRTSTPTDSFEVALAPTELATSNTTGAAILTKTTSGWRINLNVSLVRLDSGRYYQAWLEAPDGTEVPIGTFNEGNDVVLWAGVSPREFPTLTISEERTDNTQANSGRIVLTGTITD